LTLVTTADVKYSKSIFNFANPKEAYKPKIEYRHIVPYYYRSETGGWIFEFIERRATGDMEKYFRGDYQEYHDW
jgi:hypothetical protein